MTDSQFLETLRQTVADGAGRVYFGPHAKVEAEAFSDGQRHLLGVAERLIRLRDQLVERAALQEVEE